MSIIGKLKSNKLLKISFFSAISTSVKFFTIFFLSKLVSVFLGPSGLAMVGQLNNFNNIILNLATGGINQGVTQAIAENNKPQRRTQILNTALSIVLVLSLLISVILITFCNKISYWLFANADYYYVFICIGLTLFFYGANTILLSALNGLQLFKHFFYTSVLNSIVGLLISFLLFYFFRLEGILIATVTNQALVFFITIFYIKKKNIDVFKNIKFTSDWVILKKLSSFSLMTITGISLASISQIILRNYIALNLSLTKAGIWEAVTRLSSTLILLATTAISTYYLPRLSEIKENQLVWKEVVKSSKTLLPLSFVILFFVFILRHYIILTLFSKDFYEAGSILGWQLVGDFFKILSWLFAFVMWAKRMTKTFIITEVIFTVCYLILSIGLFKLNDKNLHSFTLAYAVNYFLYTIIIFAIIFKKLNENTINRGV